MDRGGLNFPQPSSLPGSTIKFSYFVIDDKPFQLKGQLQRQYSVRLLTPVKESYNKGLNTARKTI